MDGGVSPSAAAHAAGLRADAEQLTEDQIIQEIVEDIITEDSGAVNVNYPAQAQEEVHQRWKVAKEEYHKAIETLKLKYPTAEDLLTSLSSRGFAIDGLVHEDENTNLLDSEVIFVDVYTRHVLMCIHMSLCVYAFRVISIHIFSNSIHIELCCVYSSVPVYTQ